MHFFLEIPKTEKGFDNKFQKVLWMDGWPAMKTDAGQFLIQPIKSL